MQKARVVARGVFLLAAPALAALLALGSGTANGAEAGELCEKAAAKSLQLCVNAVNKAELKCYQATGVACSPDDAAIAKALVKTADGVLKKCPDADTVAAAGYGPLMTPATLAERMKSDCLAETASLASRVFGGPQGAGLAGGTAAACLATAHKEAGKLLVQSAKVQSGCALKGTKCDLEKTADKAAAVASKAADKIDAACSAVGPLRQVIALDVDEVLARTSAQARCMTAMAHPDVSPLDLDCGPRAGIAALPRGEYVQVVLDEAEWGTRCGDGSPFAFWIRLAPAGQPVENVVLQMQGGGVCVFADDCANRSPDLFEALSELPEDSGIMSNDPSVSPFANWTKVYLPYCNQDVFIGGGTTSNFPAVTVHRFGAINVRAALRYLREVLWREMDATQTEGYRPDRIRMLFGGTSAGGFGTLFNYHYVLDELQWAHTTAWPDAALSLDNGQALGVASLGALLINDTPPLGWGALDQLPPYCFATNCGLGPSILKSSAPRLKAVPEQQFLVLSNQVDQTQVDTTYFSDLPTWINAARKSYCDTKGLNGVRYYLPAISQSVHVIATRENLFTGYAVDGFVMRDWLAGAISSPDGVVDAVTEGTLVADHPGVNPFPCAVD